MRYPCTINVSATSLVELTAYESYGVIDRDWVLANEKWDSDRLRLKSCKDRIVQKIYKVRGQIYMPCVVLLNETG